MSLISVPLQKFQSPYSAANRTPAALCPAHTIGMRPEGSGPSRQSFIAKKSLRRSLAPVSQSSLRMATYSPQYS